MLNLQKVASKVAKTYAEQTWIKTQYNKDCHIRSVHGLALPGEFIAITKSGYALTVFIHAESRTARVKITDTTWPRGEFTYDEKGNVTCTKAFTSDRD